MSLNKSGKKFHSSVWWSSLGLSAGSNGWSVSKPFEAHRTTFWPGWQPERTLSYSVAGKATNLTPFLCFHLPLTVYFFLPLPACIFSLFVYISHYYFPFLFVSFSFFPHFFPSPFRFFPNFFPSPFRFFCFLSPLFLTFFVSSLLFVYLPPYFFSTFPYFLSFISLLLCLFLSHRRYVYRKAFSFIRASVTLFFVNTEPTVCFHRALAHVCYQSPVGASYLLSCLSLSTARVSWPYPTRTTLRTTMAAVTSLHSLLCKNGVQIFMFQSYESLTLFRWVQFVTSSSPRHTFLHSNPVKGILVFWNGNRSWDQWLYFKHRAVWRWQDVKIHHDARPFVM
jgi:hypothetical protein